MEFSSAISLSLLFLVLLGQTAVPLRAEDCITGFSVVAPELAVPGKTTAVLITLHGPTSLRPLNVTVKLKLDNAEDIDAGGGSAAGISAGNNQKATVEVTQEIKGHGIVPLDIPADAGGNFVLQTLVNCSGENDVCDLQSSSQMRLVGPVRDVIIRPARHAYKPGETVSFWVLALDHDLQIASDAIATISIKDPAGTKVALWYQVPLDEGIKAFNLPLSQYAQLGRWLIHVEVESAEFSAPVEVAPGAGGGLPDVAAAEEHYVELRFGKEMRRRYKPGLPFVGKVEAMSTEKSVRVRVKVYDNSTSIYSQDIEISAGEGTFVVPAIMADSHVIALQAELVSVEGKEIESHYVLAREPIYKWNSSSDCYLLIEGVEHTLQPEEEAHVSILSTCPCERDLHYVITTDGRVTDWAQRRYENETIMVTSKKTSSAGSSTAQPTSSGAICRLNFSFLVRSVMAPVSQLLVYYVTPQGEPISDVISFDVKLLHKQVYVNLENKEWWLPGESLDTAIVAEPSSLVCLLGGRSRGSADLRFDPRISEDRTTSSITGEIDFLEAGVSFFQRQCVKRGDSGISAVSYRQRGSGAGPSDRRRPPESLVGGAPFDHLWLWKCFNYTSEIASTGLIVDAPQEAGKWSLWALTVASGGLRFSAPVAIRVFRPLQVEFRLPPSLRVGETVEVDIKIANNINSCMDVTALLALSEGAQFLSNGLLYVTERLRLGPQGATSLVVRMLVTTPGLKNMTVEVNGYTSPSCEGTSQNAAGGSDGTSSTGTAASMATTSNSSLAGAVVRSATVRVHPEGLVRADTESAYFCANENMLVSTSDNFGYEWMGAPRNRAGLVVEIRAGGEGPSTSSSGAAASAPVPVHLALAENRLVSDRMYRITLGDADNTLTWLGRGKHEYGIRLASVETPDILSADHWRTFWLSWEKNVIMLGRGATLHNDTVFKWKMDKKLKIQQIGFASAWGSVAEFRVWNFNDESGFSQVLHLDTPKSLVPGSESGELTVSGGLSLPEPRLDEEANRGGPGGLARSLASLAPLLKLKHAGAEANETEKSVLLDELPKHVQILLAYRKPDNSFSEHQMVGSHRSTVAILKALVETQSYFGVDPELIQGATRWIQLRQEDDGSFNPLPADLKISDRLPEQSERNASFALLEQIAIITAETLITFHEYPVENSEEIYNFNKATAFLADTLPKVKGPEALAAVTLALTLYKNKQANIAIDRLRNASTTEEGEFGWPYMTPKRDAADWLYESEEGKALKESPIATVEDYKASIYALWTYCQIEDLKLAESAARYLFYRSHMLDKHPELVYPAVKAFAHFDTLVNDKHRSLTISLATSGMELTDTIELKRTKPPSQVLHLPSLPTKVFVYATGAGCATIRGRITYSTYSVTSTTPLIDLWSGIVQEILPDRSSVEEIEGKLPMLKIKQCFKWKGTLPSGVLRLEVTLFSGFELASITRIMVNSTENMAEMQHGTYANDLWFVFANISTNCPVCIQYVVRSNFIVSSLRPAFARIYPASRIDLAAETFFHARTSNSKLFAGITDDDLITWFGKNSTQRGDDDEENFDYDKQCVKNDTSTLPEEVTENSTTSKWPSSQGDLIVPTAIIVEDNSTDSENITEFTTDSTSVDSIIVQSLSSKKLGEVVENTTSFEEQNYTSSPRLEEAVKDAIKAVANDDAGVDSSSTVFPKSTSSTSRFTMAQIVTTANPKLSAIFDRNLNKISDTKSNLTRKWQRLLPKHVNIEKYELPTKLMRSTTDVQHEDQQEKPNGGFTPEVKNDEYVPPDKKKSGVWGMLKETEDVNDGKTSLDEEKKIVEMSKSSTITTTSSTTPKT